MAFKNEWAKGNIGFCSLIVPVLIGPCYVLRKIVIIYRKTVLPRSVKFTLQAWPRVFQFLPIPTMKASVKGERFADTEVVEHKATKKLK